MIDISGLIALGNWIPCNKILAKKYNLETAAIIGYLCQESTSFDEKWFYCTYKKIADAIGISEYSVQKSISLLMNEKIIDSKKAGLPCKVYYSMNDEKLLNVFKLQQNSDPIKARGLVPIKASTQDPIKARGLSIINKETNNKETNKKGFIRTKKEIPIFYKEFSFFKDEFVSIWLLEFIPSKIKKKASTTERALIMQLNKIKEYSNNEYDKALDILNRTVLAGWTDFYPLKNNQTTKPNKTGSRAYETTSNSIQYPKGVEV